MAKPDLNRLKNEIASRRNEKTQTINGVAPRDAFLYGLIESLDTGRETSSSALVKTVDNKVAVKKKETARLSINEAPATPHSTPQYSSPEKIDMSPERDEQLWMEMEKRRKSTMAESMQTYIQSPTAGAPMTNYAPSGQQMQINEQYLTDNVKGIVNNHLIENFGPILEEAIKSTILEMYAVDRIKTVLQENKEMIQKIVYDTIRELQAKTKAKAQH